MRGNFFVNGKLKKKLGNATNKFFKWIKIWLFGFKERSWRTFVFRGMIWSCQMCLGDSKLFYLCRKSTRFPAGLGLLTPCPGFSTRVKNRSTSLSLNTNVFYGRCLRGHSRRMSGLIYQPTKISLNNNQIFLLSPFPQLIGKLSKLDFYFPFIN